ncbi:MAG: sigma-70 family RNA polymerase sigma factor [Chloroflexi bacterium]|nr:sigma-70 family RNA polymerase sigma factor [Chloroflexota bacterium]
MPQAIKPSFNSVAGQSASSLGGTVRLAMNDAPIIEGSDYADMSDQILLAKIAESDRQALEALYDRYGRRVFALAARMLNDPQSSEEVTQDVFMSVWRRVGSYQSGRGKFTTWLFSIAHNRTIDELRKRMRDRNRDNQNIDDHINIKEESALPADQIVAQSEFDMVKHAMKALPKEQRRVVELSYFGGFTQVEISEMTDQPLGTVKTRMRLALKKLRASLVDRMASPEL